MTVQHCPVTEGKKQDRDDAIEVDDYDDCLGRKQARKEDDFPNKELTILVAEVGWVQPCEQQ